MRRLLALLAALMLLAALPATAQAGRVSRYVDHTIGFFCEGISPTSGTGFAFIGAQLSDQFGSDVFVDYWSSAEPSGAPDLAVDYEQPISLEVVDGTLTGSFSLVDGSGNPAGQGTIDAELTPADDPFALDDVFRFGNRQERVSGTVQPLALSGTVDLDGITFDLGSCFADEANLSFFSTNPNAVAARFAERTVGCELSNADGDTGFVFLDLSTDLVFVDIAMNSADGSVGYGGFAELPQSGGAVSGTIELYDLETGDPGAGTASLQASFTATEQFAYVLKDATFRRTVSGDLLDVEGSLVFPGGYTFDLGECVGVDSTVKEIGSFPRGPKPGGKVPVNDLPTGATVLKVGSKATLATKGASPTAEARYECLIGFDEETGEEFEVPVGSTVWYTVTGTGGPITVDTAGSDYDTVMAVYTGSPGSFTTVDCVDDVPLDPVGRTLQSSITFDSVAGVTYWVQIGGFPSAVTYGNLRVAVR